MPIFLRESDVRQLLTIDEAVDAVEDAFRRLGSGDADNRPRQRPGVPGALLQVMPAAVAGIGLGLKAYTSSRAVGTRFVVLLWDDERGDLQAVIEADHLGRLRTGAASGVATRHLARSDAQQVGLIGTGGQAFTQIEALCAVRPITAANVYSPTEANRLRFAEQASERLGIPVTAVDSAAAAADGADIVTTITTAREPVLRGADLAPGTHVNAAGSNRATAREIDAKVIRRAARVVIDDRAQGQREAGDLLGAVEAGALDWDHVVELGPMVAGRAPGRPDDAAITVFESLGIAIEDVAVARRVFERARELGAGERLPETRLG